MSGACVPQTEIESIQRSLTVESYAVKVHLSLNQELTVWACALPAMRLILNTIQKPRAAIGEHVFFVSCWLSTLYWAAHMSKSMGASPKLGNVLGNPPHSTNQLAISTAFPDESLLS